MAFGLCAAQFAFLAFLMGHSLEGFGQWKALLHLALSCEAAPLGSRAGLYRRLLAALHCQLALCLGSELGSSHPSPLGLPVAEELLADSFLRRLFARFFEAVREGGPCSAPIQVCQPSVQQTATVGLETVCKEGGLCDARRR